MEDSHSIASEGNEWSCSCRFPHHYHRLLYARRAISENGRLPYLFLQKLRAVLPCFIALCVMWGFHYSQHKKAQEESLAPAIDKEQ